MIRSVLSSIRKKNDVYRNIILLIIVLISMSILTVVFFVYKISTYHFVRNSSKLHDKAIATVRKLSISDKRLPVDFLQIDSGSQKLFSATFNSMCVIKAPFTDCSFTSAFFALFLRDQKYPFRIFSKLDEHSYRVIIPFRDTIIVAQKDIKKHFDSINKGHTIISKIIGGVAPREFEIIRCGYYIYLRKMNFASQNKIVYGGGVPHRDLMLLSGVKQAFRFAACDEYGRQDNKLSFEDGKSLFAEMKESDGKIKKEQVRSLWQQIDPLSQLTKEPKYLITVASRYHKGWYLGQRIISNHAYYFISQDESGFYILGNSYQTTRPIRISPKKFKKWFTAVYFIQME